MALIECSDCGKDISDKATACPNCGRPMRDAASGFVGTKTATPEEGDVKRGTQRSKGRSEVGSALAMVGIGVGVVAGVLTGNWLVGFGLVFAALIAGIAVQYR
jgi:hypothetical protein